MIVTNEKTLNYTSMNPKEASCQITLGKDGKYKLIIKIYECNDEFWKLEESITISNITIIDDEGKWNERSINEVSNFRSENLKEIKYFSYNNMTIVMTEYIICINFKTGQILCYEKYRDPILDFDPDLITVTLEEEAEFFRSVKVFQTNDVIFIYKTHHQNKNKILARIFPLVHNANYARNNDLIRGILFKFECDESSLLRFYVTSEEILCIEKDKFGIMYPVCFIYSGHRIDFNTHILEEEHNIIINGSDATITRRIPNKCYNTEIKCIKNKICFLTNEKEIVLLHDIRSIYDSIESSNLTFYPYTHSDMITCSHQLRSNIFKLNRINTMPFKFNHLHLGTFGLPKLNNKGKKFLCFLIWCWSKAEIRLHWEIFEIIIETIFEENNVKYFVEDFC